MQQVEDRLADLADETATDFGVAEFVLGLCFEDRLLQADRDGPDDAVADVLTVKLLFCEVVDGLEQAFAECALMRAAVRRVLPVDEGEVVLAETSRVSERQLQRLRAHVHRQVGRFALGVLADQVEEPPVGDETLAVDVDP